MFFFLYHSLTWFYPFMKIFCSAGDRTRWWLQGRLLFKVAFTLGQITPRKMVTCLLKESFFYSNGHVYGVLRRVKRALSTEFFCQRALASSCTTRRAFWQAWHGKMAKYSYKKFAKISQRSRNSNFDKKTSGAYLKVSHRIYPGLMFHKCQNGRLLQSI